MHTAAAFRKSCGSWIARSSGATTNWRIRWKTAPPRRDAGRQNVPAPASAGHMLPGDSRSSPLKLREKPGAAGRHGPCWLLARGRCGRRGHAQQRMSVRVAWGV